jgi:hypothetical protein
MVAMVVVVGWPGGEEMVDVLLVVVTPQGGE